MRKSIFISSLLILGIIGVSGFWLFHKNNLSDVSFGKDIFLKTSNLLKEKTNDKPGALNLAMDIHSALFYGNVSAWVWWQGSQSKIDEFSLMSGTITGKKYAVSKHLYRYIRPGSVRVKSSVDDEAFFVTAFENRANETNTIVIINSGTADKAISLTGEGLPSTFKMYRTNSNLENCTFIKDVKTGASNSFAIPAKTIITLQAGGDVL